MPLQTVVTTEPPASPPSLHSPSCAGRLRYLRSYLSGTRRHPEQWDDDACATCGTFQYRQRTRTLRRVGAEQQEHVDANQTQQRRRTNRTY
jgi:hypothetical protein